MDKETDKRGRESTIRADKLNNLKKVNVQFADGCVKGREVGHADVRKKAWAALPGVFRLSG